VRRTGAAPLIRVATVADAERISRLLSALAEGFIVREFTPAGRAYFLAQLDGAAMHRRLADADYRFYVAERRAELAGVAAVRGPGHLYYLFVAKRFQRTGLARRLWQRVVEQRAPGGLRRFTVNASHYAVAGYRRLGFRRRGPQREINGVRFYPMAIRVAAGVRRSQSAAQPRSRRSR